MKYSLRRRRHLGQNRLVYQHYEVVTVSDRAVALDALMAQLTKLHITDLDEMKVAGTSTRDGLFIIDARGHSFSDLALLGYICMLLYRNNNV